MMFEVQYLELVLQFDLEFQLIYLFELVLTLQILKKFKKKE